MNTVHEGNVKLTLPLDAIDHGMLPAKANADKYAEQIEKAVRRRH